MWKLKKPGFQLFRKVKAPAPWMPDSAVEFLHNALNNAETYLEYGSGGSTLLAAYCGCAHVYSVESDRAFLDKTAEQARSYNKKTQIVSVYVDIGPTKKLGYPVDSSKKLQWPGYATQVWSYVESVRHSPSLILIDGRFRVSCLAYSMLKANPGTTLLFDDYAKRPRYHVIEQLIRPKAIHGGMAEFVRPPSVDADQCMAVFDEFKYKPGM
ncbi:hypothetical protein [Wenzhouxiangella limi]|uniref:Class I SAM-dependent methyltransferase n=1 Tax=Wenzhouxiangella limi TaxID=2707351 RepID=A0A845UXR2_9GAMM|nr:hypothetical protein [Wenzhouxiangella limi]NDY95294.1 hypothetical protein [Wenzhouxiangella limi]